MSRRLLIRLAADGDAAWLALGRDGAPLHGERPGWPAADDTTTVTLLVPTEDVLVLPLPELPGSPRQRRQAAPFAIEEQLASPVEHQHVVLTSQPDAVVVVARQRMDAWLQQAAAAGVRIDRMLPDGWLLPAKAPTLLLHGERALLRLAADRLLALPASQLDEQMALLAASAALPPSMQTIRIAGDHIAGQQDSEARNGIAGILAAADPQRYPDLLSALAPQLADAGPVDLLDGDYAPRHRGAGAQRSWRIAAVLAGTALLVALLSAIGEYRALDRRWQEQQAQMDALYRSVVPGAAPVADPAARLRSLLGARAQGGNQPGALELLALVAPAIAGSGRFTLDTIDYRAGALELTLRAPDVATLDSLRARLDAVPSLRAELTAATPGTAGVEGRLRVRRSGAA